MERKCLYCQKPIEDAQRSTKKYCNDNCKQLAFYKRQGELLAGTQPEEDSSDKKSEDEIIVKEEAKENLPFNDEQAVKTEKNSDILKPVEFAEPDNVKREEPLNVKEGTKEPISVNKVSNSESKITETKNSTEAKKEIVPAQPIANKEEKEKKEEYKWMESTFILKVQDKVDPDNGWKFLNPDKYWGELSFKHVKWVTLRLRCLLENMIRLSSRPAIDRYTLVSLADALRLLIASESFRYLPSSYPYTQFIKELQEKTEHFARENSQNDLVRFRLPLNRKIEFIAKRFEIGNFVPRMKFSQLDFEK